MANSSKQQQRARAAARVRLADTAGGGRHVPAMAAALAAAGVVVPCPVCHGRGAVRCGGSVRACTGCGASGAVPVPAVAVPTPLGQALAAAGVCYCPADMPCAGWHGGQRGPCPTVLATPTHVRPAGELRPAVAAVWAAHGA